MNDMTIKECAKYCGSNWATVRKYIDVCGIQVIRQGYRHTFMNFADAKKIRIAILQNKIAHEPWKLERYKELKARYEEGNS